MHWLPCLVILSTACTCCNAVYQAYIQGIFLSQEDLSYTYHLMKPTLEYAKETVDKQYKNINFTVDIIKSSSTCHANLAPAHAAEAYCKKKISAIIGPGCTKALDPVARMATAWNLPICTAGGVDIRHLNTSVFRTLIRLSFSLDRMSAFVLKVLEHFGWQHIVLIVDLTEGFQARVAESLEDLLTETEKLDVQVYKVHQTEGLVQKLRKFLLRGQQIARVGKGEVIRQLLVEAHDLGMGGGEYVFLSVELFKSRPFFGDFSWSKPGCPNNDIALKMYEALMIVSVRVPTGKDYQRFVQNILERSRIQFNTSLDESEINVIVAGFHDCLLVYAWALNQTLAEGGDPLNGSAVLTKLLNSTFDGGLTGPIYINAKGDREADYTLNDFDPIAQEMKPVINYYGASQEMLPLPGCPIHWPGGRLEAPPDVPLCGFTGNDPKCFETEPVPVPAVVSFTAIAILAIGLVAGFFIYRRMKLESELTSLWWKVRWRDITFHERLPKSVNSLPTSERTSSRGADSTSMGPVTPGTRPAIYKGMRVAVKSLNIRRVTVSRKVLVELKQLRDLTHENLIRFIGLCTDEPSVAVLTEYSPRGCLQDLLENDAIKMDWPFRFSVICDICEGMRILHESPISYHGRLKSTNCVIDGRFVVKLTDFGLRSLMAQVLPEEEPNLRALFWTAPEHLRETRPELQGSQKGDVYSFSIILQEIVARTGPFESVNTKSKIHFEPEEILDRVRVGTTPPFRPKVSPDDCPADLLDILHQCWSENPNERPTFYTIRQMMKKITKGMGSKNFLDNLLSRMEQYANNLEQLVEEKTDAFLEEKKKSEELLYEVLPRYVAEQLKSGHHCRPEAFECVTIYFSDIVGFTELSAESTPMEVVDLLNDLYTCFDAIIGNYDVYKVETIGDAYMVVSGLPIRNGNEHAREIARMSLSLLSAIGMFRIRHRPTRKLMLRIGIHSGSCAAGVVGLKMPRYCLFGDTVNTASRMESNGEAMKIHVSIATKTILDKFGSFRLTLRGDVQLKGRGIMRTFWLEGEEPDLVRKQ